MGTEFDVGSSTCKNLNDVCAFYAVLRGNLAILGTELSTVPRRRKRHPIAAFGSLRLSGGSDALIGNVRPKTSQMIAGRLDIAEAFGALSLKTKCRRKIRTIAGRKLKSFRNEWIHINLRPAFSQTRLVRGALLGNSFATAFSSPQRFKHAERHSERRWDALRPKRPGGGASLQGLEAVTDTQGITSP